ncbi:hypothetical protein RQP46_005966 [Phenoliferia psychrophenolica]
MSTNSLPTELVLRILEHALRPNIGGVGSIYDLQKGLHANYGFLRNFSLVSRQWRVLSQSLLMDGKVYVFTKSRAEKLLEGDCRKLTLDCSILAPPKRQTQPTCTFTSLCELSVPGFSSKIPVEFLHALATSSISTLKRLKIMVNKKNTDACAAALSTLGPTLTSLDYQFYDVPEFEKRLASLVALESVRVLRPSDLAVVAPWITSPPSTISLWAEGGRKNILKKLDTKALVNELDKEAWSKVRTLDLRVSDSLGACVDFPTPSALVEECERRGIKITTTSWDMYYL